MTIEKLGPFAQVNKYKKTEKPVALETKKNMDTLALSQEAQDSIALQKNTEIVHIMPDIRMERVEEVKIKLQDPQYIDDKAVLETVADRLMDDFDL